MLLEENVKLKGKLHKFYKVIRGDFSNGDADSEENVRKSVAARLAPEMRDLQAAAARELSTGSMMIALVLSYVDLGSSVAVGVSYLAIGDGKHRADAITTFAILGVNLLVQALSAWSTGEGLIATLVALCGGKTMLDTYNVVYDQVPVTGIDPRSSLTDAHL